ncbi:hypothetical protein JVT61DRAFT_15363 [Boletus reticuloceps]|uniref:Uncharacterized protein n=1 Tax=Boletus reticuloceps TaxID=495285 RepID=A0A8I2YVC0_9AGAM|nr:hypothetical protein JVT61DRAFT_15363 [Boletus reticuloceps]
MHCSTFQHGNGPKHQITDPTLQAETLVEAALDNLESTGALQHSNRMTISELLNLAIEAHNIFDATDEDIYEAVMDVKMLQEQSAVSGAGDDDPDEVVEPAPTWSEAIRAALLLRRYMNLKDLNDPFARKLEAMLGLFGQQTCRTEMEGTRHEEYYRISTL